MGLSGITEKRREERTLKKGMRSADKQIAAITNKGNVSTEQIIKTGGAQAESLTKATKEKAVAAQKKFELNPTSGNYEQSIKGLSELKSVEAMNKMRELGLAKLQQRQNRRNFLKYLREQSTSFGGKVGDLPLKSQKEIAKQYSKTERKRIMDEVDARG